MQNATANIPQATIERWLSKHAADGVVPNLDVIRRACEVAIRQLPPGIRLNGETFLAHALAVADVVFDLELDQDTIAAAILQEVAAQTQQSEKEMEIACGTAATRLAIGAGRLSLIHNLQDTDGDPRQQRARAEALRRLLLAMADDVRVILIKLAERLHDIQTLKNCPEERHKRVARETLDIFAPLANRLGIWQIKWELEDLSLRCLQPDTYRQIAAMLDERRADRESYITAVIDSLHARLSAAGIVAEISGRPKHIYSIWRKMQRKAVDFDQILDVRAVRVLVRDVTACYSALGVVHALWPPLAGEFDDYITRPKDNLYQSLHTAVIGPGGKTLEVQIRTHDMHRDAELGVAAHWRYKEGGKFDAGLERKISWLRHLLEWKRNGETEDFLDRFKAEAFQDRVYVLTPKGSIIDLPQGATPVDFAYHVHTEVGHRCRGAKVDGNIVPLTYQLKSGEQVEILTSKQGGPSRDWLNPHLGFLKSAHARAKARQWFKQLHFERNVAAGRTLLERELRRIGSTDANLGRLAQRLNFPGADELLAALGRGDLSPARAASTLEPAALPESPEPGPTRAHQARPRAAGTVEIEGVGNLLSQAAGCCKPVPPDPIVGFITRGRGVTVHRRDCPNALRLAETARERLIDVDWGVGGTRTYPVDVYVEALDRQGLLRDLTTLLANEKVNVLAINTTTGRADRIARMRLTVEIVDIAQLKQVLSRVSQLPAVLDARRSM